MSEKLYALRNNKTGVVMASHLTKERAIEIRAAYANYFTKWHVIHHIEKVGNSVEYRINGSTVVTTTFSEGEKDPTLTKGQSQ